MGDDALLAALRSKIGPEASTRFAATARPDARNDPADASAELFAVLADLPRDVTVLFIEHDMGLVFRFAERITVLVGGKVLTEGSPEEIAADSRVREVYLGEAEHA